MSVVFDRVEVIHTGSGSQRVSKRRLWWDNELAATVENVPDVASVAEDAVVVETVFESREAEMAYWDAGSGAVLPRCRILVGGEWVGFTAGRSMLDEYAPEAGLPAATLFARLRCSGLAIDPRAVFEIDLRLEDGRPAGSGCRWLPSDPEVVVSGSVDDLVAWCIGARRFPELASVSLDSGNVSSCWVCWLGRC